jgi:hypothetical protein
MPTYNVSDPAGNTLGSVQLTRKLLATAQYVMNTRATSGAWQEAILKIFLLSQLIHQINSKVYY